MESDFKVSIIGLGIMGGSMAYALRGFKNCRIAGCDRNAETLAAALKSGAISEAYSDAGDAIEGADLVIISTYPDSIVKIIEHNIRRIKKGAVVTDICGVKTMLSAKISRIIPDYADYVGSHPMAGKEVDGFESAEPDLYKNCGFIITPTEKSRAESIELIRDMAKYIGAAAITTADPITHDETIAYTSDLMHIVASALCLDFNDNMNLAYTAGAFRDCTRIALINPELWAELFLLNAEHTVKEIDRFLGSVTALRNSIEQKDFDGLRDLLERVRANKIEMQGRKP